MFTSKIIISEDFERIKEEMIEKYGYNRLRLIPKTPANDFLLDDARLVEKESYIAEIDEKIIVLMAHNFRIEAQNFLLKLLEEPPQNVKFLIVVPSKNLLLPTIKSRLICEKRNIQKSKNSLNLKLDKMDLKTLFEFLQENENLDKNELMEKITLLTEQMVKIKDFNAKELENFYESYELAKLNSKSSLILSTLLLNFYTKK
ncbi:DNA polymerase III subunit delta' [Campylobacter estrildidarum]|uniref:DNA polymerase III subunit delta n=1 Tax=Campylobacter estrildidarum TaxID=2510189 RepID=A0A4V6DWE0_9BACT|nr:DNA polymerase III subunit delta' [Campylobacter estrildidarum]TKX31822.1 DNA polymerase III subunit delta' [Campylobacter estrildidarum]